MAGPPYGQGQWPGQGTPQQGYPGYQQGPSGYAPGYPPGPPGPGPGYQQGYQPYGRQPYAPYPVPRRRKRAAGMIIVGILGGMAAVFVLFIVVAALVSGGDGPDTTSPTVARPTETSSSPPLPQNTRIFPPDATAPVDTPPPPVPTAGADPNGIPGKGRDLTRIRKSEIETILTQNPLYDGQGLGTLNCRAPRLVRGNAASMKSFLEAITNCLDSGWEAKFAASGVLFEKPQRIFWSSPGRGPCGDYAGKGPYYCSLSQGIYIGTSELPRVLGNAPPELYTAYAVVLAHEYGHHAQYRSGVSVASYHRAGATGVAAKNENSRRQEQQADCYAGLFLNATKSSLPVTSQQSRAAIKVMHIVGDDGLPEAKHGHGLGKNRAAWLTRGLQGGRPTACNTWVAPPDSVR